MEVFVSSNLYVAGRTEDGVDYTAECYVVIAEKEDGSRVCHVRQFNGCNVVHDDEDGYTGFEDIREEAKAKAEALAAQVREHLNNGGALNMEHWYHIDPMYGSAAYCSEGTEAKRIAEEKEIG